MGCPRHPEEKDRPTMPGVTACEGCMKEDQTPIYPWGHAYVGLKTPHDRYFNDPRFKVLVDLFYSYIARADFTPSEIREAAMCACVKFEMEHVRYRYIVPAETEEALAVLERFLRSLPPTKPDR